MLNFKLTVNSIYEGRCRLIHADGDIYECDLLCNKNHGKGI